MEMTPPQLGKNHTMRRWLGCVDCLEARKRKSYVSIVPPSDGARHPVRRESVRSVWYKLYSEYATATSHGQTVNLHPQQKKLLLIIQYCLFLEFCTLGIGFIFESNSRNIKNDPF